MVSGQVGCQKGLSTCQLVGIPFKLCLTRMTHTAGLLKAQAASGESVETRGLATASGSVRSSDSPEASESTLGI